jgi:hypothetical protein
MGRDAARVTAKKAIILEGRPNIDPIWMDFIIR